MSFWVLGSFSFFLGGRYGDVHLRWPRRFCIYRCLGVLGHLICSFLVQGFLNPRFFLVEGILSFRFMGPRLFGFWVYDF